MAQKLAAEQRTEALGKVPDWVLVDGRDAISRSFKFRDFNEAFGFMTRAALVAMPRIPAPRRRRARSMIRRARATGGPTNRPARLLRLPRVDPSSDRQIGAKGGGGSDRIRGPVEGRQPGLDHPAPMGGRGRREALVQVHLGGRGAVGLLRPHRVGDGAGRGQDREHPGRCLGVPARPQQLHQLARRRGPARRIGRQATAQPSLQPVGLRGSERPGERRSGQRRRGPGQQGARGRG